MNICLSFFKFYEIWSSERNTENTSSDLYLNKESDYSEDKASGNEKCRLKGNLD